MQLIFDSVDEVRTFVKNELKGQRGKKDDGEGDAGTAGSAPPLAMPPQQGQQPAFNPQTAAFTPPTAFPGGTPSNIDPATQAIVGRIVARIDGAIGSGQPADAVLTWFRGQCGAEAANATMDQIKQNFLPKLAMPTLENIAKLMNA